MPDDQLPNRMPHYRRRRRRRRRARRWAEQSTHRRTVEDRLVQYVVVMLIGVITALLSAELTACWTRDMGAVEASGALGFAGGIVWAVLMTEWIRRRTNG
jgi:hypothetical protein